MRRGGLVVFLVQGDGGRVRGDREQVYLFETWLAERTPSRSGGT